jgi:hypothetical protein
MNARLISIGAAIAAVTTGALAEPAKAPVPAINKPSNPPKPVILASADTVETAGPQSAQQLSPAPKKRAARVTTCRCGDPQPESSER